MGGRARAMPDDISPQDVDTGESEAMVPFELQNPASKEFEVQDFCWATSSVIFYRSPEDFKAIKSKTQRN
jgi:hypothetical protein